MSENRSYLSGIFAGVGLSTALFSAYSYLKSKPSSAPFTSSPSVPQVSVPSEILTEQFIRNTQFLGEENQKKVHNARVIVVGAGGVGSHAALALARAGVMNIRIIDFDRVTVSSLNRHATATLAHVGLAKVESIKLAISAFLPTANIDAVEEMFTLDSADRLIDGWKPDYVVDCIDNVPTKTDLLAFCVKNNIHVITSCGSACKKDPSKVRLSALDNVHEDELGKTIKQKLRKQEIELTKIKCVFSVEKSEVKLMPLKDFQKHNTEEYRSIEKFRVRILPVLGFLPAIFGQSLAAVVVTDIGEFPIAGNSTKELLSNKTKKALWEMYAKFYGISWREVERLFPGEISDELMEAYGGKCGLSGKVTGALVFVPRGVGVVGDVGNVMLVSKALAEAHMKKIGLLAAAAGAAAAGPDAVISG